MGVMDVPNTGPKSGIVNDHVLKRKISRSRDIKRAKPTADVSGPCLRNKLSYVSVVPLVYKTLDQILSVKFYMHACLLM